MKRNFLIFFLLFNCTVVFGQKNDEEPRVVSVSKITFLEPGFSQEFATGKSTTIMLRGGVTATLAMDEFEEKISAVLFRAFGAASFRVYFNFEKRENQGKNTDNNSANYIGLLGMYASKPFNKGTGYNPDYNNTLLNAGIVWGMQRNYPSGFSLDLNIGPGYGRAGDSVSGFTIVGEFTLGWRISKNEK